MWQTLTPDNFSSSGNSEISSYYSTILQINSTKQYCLASLGFFFFENKALLIPQWAVFCTERIRRVSHFITDSDYKKPQWVRTYAVYQSDSTPVCKLKKTFTLSKWTFCTQMLCYVRGRCYGFLSNSLRIVIYVLEFR